MKALSIVALVACGSSSDPPTDHTPKTAAATAIDACTLLTRDDVVSAMGHGGYGAGKSKDGGLQCRFASGRGNSVTVYAQAAPRAQWDELRASLVRHAKEGTDADVPGVGDAAYYWDARLYVHRGAYEVTIHISPDRPEMSAEDIARDRAKALVLARRAVARLP